MNDSGSAIVTITILSYLARLRMVSRLPDTPRRESSRAATPAARVVGRGRETSIRIGLSSIVKLISENSVVYLQPFLIFLVEPGKARGQGLRLL